MQVGYFLPLIISLSPILKNYSTCHSPCQPSQDRYEISLLLSKEVN